jgi:hypothetical protein
LCRSLSSRKGASEVIAAMLLIVIAVAATVLLYVYVSGLMGSLQGGSVQQQYLEQISLDYYDWTTLSTLKLTLRNVGVAKVTFSDFFIAGQGNTTALTFGSGCNSPRGVLTVQSSCVVTFSIPTGFSATSGIVYSVRVISIDGAIFSFSCIAGRAGSTAG